MCIAACWQTLPVAATLAIWPEGVGWRQFLLLLGVTIFGLFPAYIGAYMLQLSPICWGIWVMVCVMTLTAAWLRLWYKAKFLPAKYGRPQVELWNALDVLASKWSPIEQRDVILRAVVSEVWHRIRWQPNGYNAMRYWL
jgi:hypothetical protein